MLPLPLSTIQSPLIITNSPASWAISIPRRPVVALEAKSRCIDSTVIVPALESTAVSLSLSGALLVGLPVVFT